MFSDWALFGVGFVLFCTGTLLNYRAIERRDSTLGLYSLLVYLVGCTFALAAFMSILTTPGFHSLHR